MYQPSGAESYSGPDLKRWGAGTLGLGRGGAAGEGGRQTTGQYKMVASWLTEVGLSGCGTSVCWLLQRYS